MIFGEKGQNRLGGLLLAERGKISDVAEKNSDLLGFAAEPGKIGILSHESIRDIRGKVSRKLAVLRLVFRGLYDRLARDPCNHCQDKSA